MVRSFTRRHLLLENSYLIFGPMRKKLLLLLVPTALAFLAYWFSFSIVAPIVLPEFGPAPRFAFQSEKGTSVSSDSLKGKVTLMNFFFSRCPAVCPTLNGKIATLARAYKDDPYVHFVSITIDPEFDNQAVLSEYAQRFQSNPDNWDFLTGDKAEIGKLRREGFKLDNGETIELHTTRIVLIDSNQNVRGYYQGTDDDEVKRLSRDLQTLLPVVLENDAHQPHGSD